MASDHSGKDFWTYVMVGEGCLNEGESWEGIMAAAKFKPKKLVLLVDYNKVQLDGSSEDIMPMATLKEKFKSFNWVVAPDDYNGHDMASVHESFKWLDKASAEGTNAGPYVIVYNTLKGKGVSFMENTHVWHGAPVDDDTFARAMPELEKGLAALEETI